MGHSHHHKEPFPRRRAKSCQWPAQGGLKQILTMQDIYTRDLQYYWKTNLFHRFGGKEWFYIMSAIGHVPGRESKCERERE